MYILKNLPVFLTLIASIIITILEIQYGADYKEISYKLIVCIIVFYSIGYVLRKILSVFILKILENIEKRAIDLARKEAEEAEIKNEQVLDEEFEPYMPKKFEPHESDR